MSSQGPPGLQYPKLPKELDRDLTSAVRNIIDNLFYIRKQLATPATPLSTTQVSEVRRIVSSQLVTVLNTVNNITQNIINNFAGNATLVGSHNLRLTTYGAASQPVGTLFYETDRHVLYVIEPTPNHWQFVAGVMLGAYGSEPADLGSNDAGFLYFATDTEEFFIWDGTAFINISGGTGTTPPRGPGITIDGGGAVITTGIHGDLYVPYSGIIQAVTLLADQAGSVVLDIWKTAYPTVPTVANTITAAAKPTITAASQSQDLTLVGWTTTINAGDRLRFNVDSASTITRLNAVLTVQPT